MFCKTSPNYFRLENRKRFNRQERNWKHGRKKMRRRVLNQQEERETGLKRAGRRVVMIPRRVGGGGREYWIDNMVKNLHGEVLMVIPALANERKDLQAVRSVGTEGKGWFEVKNLEVFFRYLSIRFRKMVLFGKVDVKKDAKCQSFSIALQFKRSHVFVPTFQSDRNVFNEDVSHDSKKRLQV